MTCGGWCASLIAEAVIYYPYMKTSDSGKLDQIIAMLGDMVAVFGGRFDRIDDTLEQHSKLLSEHTRDLNQIKHDVAENLDKRKQLEVRVTNIERKVAS